MNELNINNQKSRPVICLNNRQDTWGGGDDASKYLEVGKTYTAVRFEVHQWHTRVFLAEFPDRWFNSVVFGEVIKGKTSFKDAESIPYLDELVNIALKQFDNKTQDLILIEEMSELTKALLKLRRLDAGVLPVALMQDVIEELAHVLVSAEVVRRICGISKYDIGQMLEKKVNKYRFL